MTEGRNPATMDIDRVPTIEMLEKINREDRLVADAVAKTLPEIAKTVDAVAECFANGGRLFYIGAGTSGRLGILDASECPPTYGTDPELVQGIIAGGMKAIFQAVEGAEDDVQQAKEDLLNRGMTKDDFVIGIAASGRTPYVVGGLKFAKEAGAGTAGICCSPGSEIGKIADFDIAVLVGPEALTGSTRMKAGTAQKMVLNMITTGAMIKSGRVYSNLMVNVESTNRKLVERSRRIVAQATGAAREDVERAMEASGSDVKTAIVMLKLGVGAEEAENRLAEHKGIVARALGEAER
jgi:N-acetylmuramic acid 6-phosphate etherase